MILSDTTIKKYLKAKKISISPPVEECNIRPTGIRIHLSDEILIPEPNQIIDLRSPQDIYFKQTKISTDGYVIGPGEHILASSIESISTNKKLLCLLDGRSTLARLGLQIHATSNIIDNIAEEQRVVVLELYNSGCFQLRLYQNMPIGLIYFSTLTENITQGNQIQYSNQNSVKGPNFKFKNDNA